MPCRSRKNAMQSKIERGRFLLDQGFPKEALKKGLSLFLDSGRVRLCEAPCGTDVVLFRDSQKM
jgi:hypothetical protein